MSTTVATTVTNSTGGFTLNIPGFTPEITATYIFTELAGTESPHAMLGGQAIGHIDVHVGKSVYLLSMHAGGYGSNKGLVRGEVFWC